jgi:transposase
MSFSPIMQSAIGLFVHSKSLVACHLTKDDETGEDTHEFGPFSTFKTWLEELAKRVVDHGNHSVMMESANVYRMMPRKVLMRHGVKCVVVNARHIKNAPGHKTDFADSLRNTPRRIKKPAQLGHVAIKTGTENAAEASEPAREARPKRGRKPKTVC